MLRACAQIGFGCIQDWAAEAVFDQSALKVEADGLT